jgi:replication initiation protein RepC
LSPLARLATVLERKAQDARTQRDDLLALRATVGGLRHDVLEREGQSALSEVTRQELRRKPCETRLTDLARLLKDRITAFDADQVSASDSQNERHIQYVKKIYSDSETNRDDKQTVQPVEATKAETHKDIELGTVLQTCQAFQEFYPDPITSWQDLIAVADKIAPMIGIDGPVWQQAGQAMGYRRASIVVLYILENLDTIHNPGGYLRHLTKTARAGAMDVAPLLAAIGTRGGIVS